MTRVITLLGFATWNPRTHQTFFLSCNENLYSDRDVTFTTCPKSTFPVIST